MSLRTVALLLALLFALVASSTAYADHVAIVKFDGPQAKAMQKSLQKALQAHDYDVLVVEGRGDEADVIATISATISKSKKRWRVVFEVWGADGESLATASLQANNGPGLAAKVDKLVWKRLREALDAAKTSAAPPKNEQEVASPDLEPVSSPEQEPEPSLSPQPDPGAHREPATSGAHPMDGHVALGPRVVGRRFNYKDDLFKSLTSYDVPATAALMLEADYYPLRQFGLAAAYSYTPSFNSALNGVSTEPFPTTSQSFMLGARARYDMAKLQARLDADYGGQNFTIKGFSPGDPLIPNVRYRFIRLGVGGRMALVPRLAVGVQAGYRHLLSTGQIESQSYFPRLEAAAVDGRISIELGIASSLYVELAGTVERYFFTMNPEVGDALVAGGAADQYLGAQLLLQYRL